MRSAAELTLWAGDNKRDAGGVSRGEGQVPGTRHRPLDLWNSGDPFRATPWNRARLPRPASVTMAALMPMSHWARRASVATGRGRAVSASEPNAEIRKSLCDNS